MVGAWQSTAETIFSALETYENLNRKRRSAWQWLVQWVEQPKATPTAASSTPDELTLTAVALGLATTGALVFPPAQVACLPLLLYLGLTPARTVYQALRAKEAAPLALAEAVVLALCLLRQAYLAGAVSYGCYVVAKAWLQQPADPPLPTVAWQPPTWAWVQPGAVERPKPVAELHRGERIVVHTGEMVPVTGVVTDGIAWVKCRGIGGIKVKAGCQVEAMTIVQVGCIGLTVG